MRLIVSQIVLEQLQRLEMCYPNVSDERRQSLDQYREILLKD